MTIEAMRQWLEALEINLVFLRNVKPFKGQEDLASDCVAMTEETITSLRQAIAEADKQEQNLSELFKCSIKPRPLAYSLHEYHTAMSEGPLHHTWTDKPHRLVYDLIAAVKYYTYPQPKREPLTDEQIHDLDPMPHQMFDKQRIDFARAIEAAHGIKE